MTTLTLKPAAEGGTPVRRQKAPWPYLGKWMLGEEELALLQEVIRHQQPFRENGPDEGPTMVQQLEREASAYFHMPYAMGTATGSGSFFCALAGLGIGPGDEVLIPSLAWYTDFFAPVQLGATPVFVDIDRSLNMSVQDMARKITPRTRAAIVVHYQGMANHIDELTALAHDRGVAVVEDCAQSIGARFNGNMVGSFGDVACFSFQQNKVITTGDGGLLLAKDPAVFERAARYHDLGNVRKSLAAQLPDGPRGPKFAGNQYRMNAFTAAVALGQLRKLERGILGPCRRANAMIREALDAQCPGIRYRDPGGARPGEDCGSALFIDMRNPQRAKRLADYLDAENILTGPPSGCANLLHCEEILARRMVHPALPPFGPGMPGEHVRYGVEQCPATDDLIASMVCLPLTPRTRDQDVAEMIEAVVKVWPCFITRS
ncbi:MAG: aminotransferase class V-fold PLP-dependent enzyme [Phycisphaeraceae bacterium]|nr:aminotransferase class V-fold PLP-dependent enzyme [Phycisphaeraceae bacterium]